MKNRIINLPLKEIICDLYQKIHFSSQHPSLSKFGSVFALLFCSLLFQPEAIAVSINGKHVEIQDSISIPNEIDTYSFTLAAGESVQIRMADVNNTDIFPYIRLINPNNDLITSSGGYQVAAIRSYTAPISGTYTIQLSSGSGSGVGTGETGSYILYFARLSGANEHGLLADSDSQSGRIDLGDIDTYTFAANIGESIQIRLADLAHQNTGDFFPNIHLYDPSGDLVYERGGYLVAAIRHYEIVEDGIYTVVLTAGHGNGAVDTFGDYQLYFARLSGANELGPLKANDSRTEKIDLGDIDTYTFTVTAGGVASFTMTDLNTPDSNLFPSMQIYGPGGNILASSGDYTQASIQNFQINENGTYTAVLTAGHGNGAEDTFGDYVFEATIEGLAPVILKIPFPTWFYGVLILVIGISGYKRAK